MFLCAFSMLIIAADENIRSVWSDEETVTFLKWIHETNINVIFPSCFLHALRHLLLISMNQLLGHQPKLTFGNMALWWLSFISMGMCSDTVLLVLLVVKWLKYIANNTFSVSQNGKPTGQITGPGRVLAHFFKFIFVHGVVIVGNKGSNITCFPVLSCSIVQLVHYRNQLLITFMLCSVWSHYNVMHLNSHSSMTSLQQMKLPSISCPCSPEQFLKIKDRVRVRVWRDLLLRLRWPGSKAKGPVQVLHNVAKHFHMPLWFKALANMFYFLPKITIHRVSTYSYDLLIELK